MYISTDLGASLCPKFRGEVQLPSRKAMPLGTGRPEGPGKDREDCLSQRRAQAARLNEGGGTTDRVKRTNTARVIRGAGQGDEAALKGNWKKLDETCKGKGMGGQSCDESAGIEKPGCPAQAVCLAVARPHLTVAAEVR